MSQEHDHPKVLIIGLDSADYNFMKSYLENSYFTNINDRIEKGVISSLTTTIPDMTPPAWTSITTGVNPGRHNVYGFFQQEGSAITITNSKTRKSSVIWDRMENECGKVLMNIPGTYPVSEINGCIVSDNLTSNLSGKWVYPEREQRNLIDRKYDKCLVSIESAKKGFGRLLWSVNTRAAAFMDLLQRYKWCFGMVVFSETDWVQHLYPTNQRKILQIYKKIDEFIGKLVKEIKDETLLLILSDHGYQVTHTKVLLNNWLLKCGLLNIKPAKNIPVRKDFITRVSEKYGPKLLPVAKLLPARVTSSFAAKTFRPSDDLNSVSGVYQIGWDLGQYLRLYVTSDKKESYHQFYTLLKSQSEKLIDPKRGIHPIRDVFTKEIYSGVYSINAPDFLLELNSGYSGSENMIGNKVFLDYTSGTHNDTGILIASWINSNRKVAPMAQIPTVYDIAPTVLKILGGKLPATDGRIISEIQPSARD